MGFSLEYCTICKDDFERMRLGYNPHGEDCGRWQCHLLDILNFLLIAVLGIILIIPLIIVLLFFAVYNILEGSNYAIQKQSDEKEVHAGLGRKKSRKSRMVTHAVARSKPRSKKRAR